MEIFIGSNSWFGGQRVFGLTHSRTGVKPGIPPVPLKGRTLATYLPSASHDLSGKPIPAPLKCHSAGRGTSVPTENTDACRWSDYVSRREPAAATYRQTTTRKGSTEATKHQRSF